MVTIILTVVTVSQLLGLRKQWRHSDGELSSLLWQATAFGLTLVALAIMLFLDFGLRVDRLPSETPAEALRAMKLHHQRVAYSVAAMLFGAVGLAVYLLKIHRRAA